MSDMTIYRVQDKEGRGPFKPGFSQKWVIDRSDLENLLPWPFEFGPVHKKLLTWEHAGCGCQTIAQLRRWFIPKEYKTLQDFGYQAVKMEVNRLLACGPTQCVFARRLPLNEGIEVVNIYKGL